MDQKRNTLIESIGVYLPPDLLSTDEVLQGCYKAIKFPLEKITGIKKRHIAGKQEFSIDLARKAIVDCLNNSHYQPADIDLLICCNISRYDAEDTISFEPSTSIRLRQEMGFHQAVVFDISNACAGMFTGIYLVDAMIRSGAVRRGMLVSGEYITHLTRTAQKEIESFLDSRLACLTLGDAGAAVILEASPDPQVGFQALDLMTFGRYSPFCTAKVSEGGGMIMYTDSVNLTDVAIKSGAENALGTLQRAGWSPESFQHLIMHQTSKLTLNSARREINRLLDSPICHDGNTINNLEQRGNTASTAHFVALADLIRQRRVRCGDKIIFGISASGLTTGTALYVFDDLPDRVWLNGSRPSSGQRTNLPHPIPAGPGIRIESIGLVPEVASGSKHTMDLLKRAGTNCRQRSAYRDQDVDLLIYTGVYRSEYLLEPAYATLLAGELNINATLSQPQATQTLAFDIFNGAIGFLNACYVSQQMIAAGNCQTAMIVAAESENNADNCPDQLMGIRETASAVMLDAHPEAGKGFSQFLFRYADEFLSAYTTSFNPNAPNKQLYIAKDAELETHYINSLLPFVRELLELAEMELHQIDLIFPPQISSGFITRLSAAFGLSRAKFVDAVGSGPDLFSSGLPYAMAQAETNGLVKPGATGLVIAVGSGLQLGGALYHF